MRNLSHTPYPPHHWPSLLRWLAAVAWAITVLLLTTLPGHVPPVSIVSHWFGGTEFSSVVGHICMFSLLTLLVWQALCQWFRWRLALLMTMSAVLMLGTTTELFQWFVVGRMSTLADLLANWLGVFVGGFLASFSVRAEYRVRALH